MKLPGLSPHPNPPPPQELGAAPIFHPFCFNPSACPQPGLEIPTVTPGRDRFTVQADTAAPTAPRPVQLSGRTPSRLLLPWLSPKPTTIGVFLQPFFGCGPKRGVEGHKPPFMVLILPHTSRASQALAGEWGQPLLHKKQGEDSKGGGMSSRPAVTSSTRRGC